MSQETARQNTVPVDSVLKVAGFVMLFAFLFYAITSIFCNPGYDVYAKVDGWKQQDENTVLVIGNSHAKDAVLCKDLSAAIDERIGQKYTVYNASINGMKIEQAQFYVQELLRHQKPKLVVLEGFIFCPLEEGDFELDNRKAFDELPFRQASIDAANYAYKWGSIDVPTWASLVVSIPKYHTRWKSLTPADITKFFTPEDNAQKGFTANDTTQTEPDPSDGYFEQNANAITEERALEPSQREAFDALLKTLADAGVPVCILTVPYKNQNSFYSTELIKVNNYLQRAYPSILQFDLNTRWEELNFGYSDLFNEGHLNGAGAQKVTPYAADFIATCLADKGSE